MLMKRTLIAILGLALLQNVMSVSTYAKEVCDTPTIKVVEKVLDIGTDTFGQQPDISVLGQDYVLVVSKLIGNPDVVIADKIYLFQEPGVDIGFILFSKDGCTLSLARSPAKQIEAIRSLVDTSKSADASHR